MVMKARLKYWTTENRDTIIIENALISYTWTDNHTIFLGPMFVHPKHRRQGLGQRLLELCQQVDGVERISAASRIDRDDVTRLMQKAGYTYIGEDKELMVWEWKKNPS